MLDQIIRAACFGVCSRHVEAPERLVADDRAGAAAVEIKVSDVEIAAGLLEMFAVV